MKVNLNKKFKEELKIMSVMRKANHNSSVVEESLTLLKLEEKTEDEILFFMKKSKYHWLFCKKTIHLLKSEANIFRVIKESGYDPHVCNAGFSLLNLNEEENKIYSLIVQSNWDSRTCREGIKIFSGNRK